MRLNFLSVFLSVVQAANLTSLKADIARGMADIASGRVRELDINDIKQRGRAALAARQPA